MHFQEQLHKLIEDQTVYKNMIPFKELVDELIQANSQNQESLTIYLPIENANDLDALLENTNVTTIFKEYFGLDKNVRYLPGAVSIEYPFYTTLYKSCLIRPKEYEAESRHLTFFVQDIIEDLASVKHLASHLPIDLASLERVELADDYPTHTYDSSCVKMTFEKGKLMKISFSKEKTPREIVRFVEHLEQAGFYPEQIEWASYNETPSELELLLDLAKKYPIKVKYLKNGLPTTLEKFFGMRQTIDYYKSLIGATDLSPVEKLTFAYDIIKSFKYNERKAGTLTSRDVPDIVESGEIVCVGYSKFLEQLLEELNIPSTRLDVTIKYGEYHSRIMTRIDDDKYDIHGIFVLDPTWDNNKEHLALVEDEKNNKHVRYRLQENDTVLKEYDGLTLYQNFLIPLTEYQKTYPAEATPKFVSYVFDNLLGNNKSTAETEDIDALTKSQIHDLFGEIPLDETVPYFLVRKPSLETFEEILTTVRRCEGYTGEYLSNNIQDVISLNTIMDEVYNPNQTFFKKESKGAK